MALNQRILNTEVYDTAGIGSVSSGWVTVPAGTYRCRAFASAVNSQQTQLLLYDNTHSAVLCSGLCLYVNSASSAGPTMLEDTFTLAGTTAIGLQHFIQAAQATFGLGLNCSVSGANELYSQLWLEKIA